MSSKDWALAREDRRCGCLSAKWAASFRARLISPRIPTHQGALSLSSNGRLALMDEDGVIIDARLLREDESVTVGDVVLFACYLDIIRGRLDLISA